MSGRRRILLVRAELAIVGVLLCGINSNVSVPGDAVAGCSGIADGALRVQVKCSIQEGSSILSQNSLGADRAV
jgi:hypothetical protein